MCVRSLLDLIEPLKMKEWRDCYIKKIAKVDLRVAGSVMAANLECWCETKVQDALQEYGCCASPDFALLCMAECKPDCAKPAAAKCVKECPGFCLENDYAPEFCASSCGSCGAHILCIAEQSKKLTEAGNPENPLLCHDIPSTTAQNGRSGWSATRNNRNELIGNDIMPTTTATARQT